LAWNDGRWDVVNASLTIMNGEVVPVFPLPRFVMFPYITTPLHVFEPRYRRMIESRLDRRGLLCLATLRGQWRKKYETKEADIHPIGVVAELTNYDCLPDGRYNIVVYGRHRVRMHEVESDQSFRMARIELCETAHEPEVDREDVERLRRMAKHVLLKGRDTPAEMAGHIDRLPPRMLLNVMCFYGPMTTTSKLSLLAMNSYTDMAARLTRLYTDMAGGAETAEA
jgi:Lon protease-like protein